MYKQQTLVASQERRNSKNGRFVTLQIAQQSNNLVETSNLAIANKIWTVQEHENR